MNSAAEFSLANWESAPTLSRQINVPDVNAHNHYWFKMNSLLYHERFITWHDWVCLALTQLDHEMRVVQRTGNHLRRRVLRATMALWCECNGAGEGGMNVINITFKINRHLSRLGSNWPQQLEQRCSAICKYRSAPLTLAHACTRTVKLWLVSKVM